MNHPLQNRLDQIEARITDSEFLATTGIGNEIACYIFDYPAEHELQVREHYRNLRSRLASHHGGVNVLHLDLLEVVLSYLESRGLLDRALDQQKSKGDAGLIRALAGPLSAERIRDFIQNAHAPASSDLILVTGVGNVWPVLRTHALLNCLHSVIGATPLVLFYPGRFDGVTLNLFGQLDSDHASTSKHAYYRAFALIPS